MFLLRVTWQTLLSLLLVRAARSFGPSSVSFGEWLIYVMHLLVLMIEYCGDFTRTSAMMQAMRRMNSSLLTAKSARNLTCGQMVNLLVGPYHNYCLAVLCLSSFCDSRLLQGFHQDR
jgi:hypothetical protein